MEVVDELDNFVLEGEDEGFSLNSDDSSIDCGEEDEEAMF